MDFKKALVPGKILSQRKFQGLPVKTLHLPTTWGLDMKNLESIPLRIYILDWVTHGKYILYNIVGVSILGYYIWLRALNCRLSCSLLALGHCNLHRRCIYALHSLSQKFSQAQILVFWGYYFVLFITPDEQKWWNVLSDPFRSAWLFIVKLSNSIYTACKSPNKCV